jgi:hypothetical protein
MKNLIDRLQYMLSTDDNPTPEHIKLQEKYSELYDNLYAALNEENRKQLNNVVNECFMIEGLSHIEGFTEGFKAAFKLITEAIS